VEKIYQIDDHVAAMAAGLIADARSLVQMSRIRAQTHKITYGEPIDVWNLAKNIGNRMQVLTQYGGLRPYGISLILAGVDKSGPHVIESDPSGTLFEWRAFSIGRGGSLANKMLNQKWKENMSEKEAVALALDIIDKTEKEKKEGEPDLAIIKKGDRFKKLSEDHIKSILK
jgi:proteasome alpha subunit